MKLLAHKYSHSLILLSLFLIAEIIINPIGEFSLNDDWSYTKSVETLNNTGVFEIGYWPAMTLYAHVLWGLLFVKVFGFSFTVLRISVLILSLITLLTIHKLVFNITHDKKTALVFSLLLFVNPLFVNLSNSYMTDVSFLCFVVLSVYFFHQQFLFKKSKFLLLGFLFFLVALFIRQLALTIPIAFIAICMWNVLTTKKGVQVLINSIFLFLGSLLILFFFEKTIFKTLADFSSYQGVFFSKSKIDISCTDFLINFHTRFGILLLYLGLTVFPVMIFKLRYIIMKTSSISILNKIFIVAMVSILYIVYSGFPIGNVMYNTGLGLETTPDTFHFKMKLEHTHNPFLFETIKIISLLGSVLFIVFMFISDTVKKTTKVIDDKTKFSVFIFFILFLYVFLFAMFSSFYDRYSLSFTALALLLIANKQGFKITKPKLVLCVIFLYSLFSVFATKDYFNYNRIKENIIVDLMHNKKVKAEDIHGGFEFMMWHFYDTGGWNRYWDHRGYEYQITFGGDLQPYHIIEKHPYKRYFPFKVDTLYLIQKNAE